MTLGWCCRACDVQDIRDPEHAPHRCGPDGPSRGGKRYYIIELTADEVIDLVNKSEHYGPPVYLDPAKARLKVNTERIRIEVEL